MQDNQVQNLTSFPLFSSFDQGFLTRLFATAPYSIRMYAKDQIICLAGETCNSLHLILDGKVSLQSLDEEGRLFKAQVLGSGELYGATLLFGTANSYPLTVVAEYETELLSLSRALVLALCKADTRFTEKLLQIVSDKAYALSNTITSLASKTLREKLLTYLREEASRQGSNTFDLPIAKKELAHRLGVERTSLSRALALLRDEHILTFWRERITLLNE